DREERRERREEALPGPAAGHVGAGEVERPDSALARAQDEGALASRGPACRPELDAAALRSQRLRDRLPGADQLILDARAVEKRERQFGKQGLLTLSLLGFRCSSPSARGQVADDERREQVDGKGEPVLAVLEPECVSRRQEEPVEREH